MIGLEIIDPANPLFILFVILVTLFIGDNVFIIMGFGASQGYFEWWLAILFFWAIVLTDYPFYWLGKSKYLERLKKTKFFARFFNRMDETLDFVTANNLFLAFLYCKFISGAKPWINIYLGEKRVSTKKFIIMTLIAAIIWSLFAFLIGYVSGQGFSFVWQFFQSLSIAIFFLIIIFALFFKFIKKFKQYIHKKCRRDLDYEDEL